MLNSFLNRIIFSLALLYSLSTLASSAHISGQLKLDSSWEKKVYLCYIPTFQEMHSISNDMILAEAPLDDSGSFSLDLSFLDEESQLFRLHVCKKGNNKASLIIGGEDENHLFLLASSQSQIKLKNREGASPFSQVEFFNSPENNQFGALQSHIKQVENQASASNAAKRQFLKNQLRDYLIQYADTAKVPMAAAYALFETPYERLITNKPEHYEVLVDNWNLNPERYSKTFTDLIPKSQNQENSWWPYLALLLLPLGFYLGKRSKSNKGLKKLSVQEYKIYEHLKQGASNQEISDEFNIGISTVKSHVSSILSKLKVKSRKDLLKP